MQILKDYKTLQKIQEQYNRVNNDLYNKSSKLGYDTGIKTKSILKPIFKILHKSVTLIEIFLDICIFITYPILVYTTSKSLVINIYSKILFIGLALESIVLGIQIIKYKIEKIIKN